MLLVLIVELFSLVVFGFSVNVGSVDVVVLIVSSVIVVVVLCRNEKCVLFVECFMRIFCRVVGNM